MSAVLKLFRSGEKKKNVNSSQSQAAVKEIGMPTLVSHNFSGKVNPDGTIQGIPESWKQRLKLMITNEEALNPQNKEKATQLLKWIDNRDTNSDEFMRVNSESPPSSIVSSETSSGASFVSYLHEVHEEPEDVDNQEEQHDSEEDNSLSKDSMTSHSTSSASLDNTAVVHDNSVVNEPSQTVCDNELPTLRRKKKDNHTTRQGPRVTRNLSDETIISELHDCCTLRSPWEFYTKVML